LPFAASTSHPQNSAQLSVPSHASADLRRVQVGQTLADVERHLIIDTLDHCLGNRTHAAKILGISIRTLRNKLNEYMDAGIQVPEPGQKPSAVS
jgi:DNA-binding NtrC family response regulator